MFVCRGSRAPASLLSGIGDGVIIVDASGAPVRWNRAAETFVDVDALRRRSPTWIGRDGVCGTDGAPLAPDRRPLARALRGEDVDDAEIVVER